MKSKITYSYRVPIAGCIHPGKNMPQSQQSSLPYPTLQDFINYQFIKQNIKA